MYYFFHLEKIFQALFEKPCPTPNQIGYFSKKLDSNPNPKPTEPITIKSQPDLNQTCDEKKLTPTRPEPDQQRKEN